MIINWKKWWAWQGLNLRPLRCQHSHFNAKARKSAIPEIGSAERAANKRPDSPIFTAPLPRTHFRPTPPREGEAG